MYSKRSDDGDVSTPRRIRTSDRLRRSPNLYSRTYVLYTPTIIRAKKSKTKSRTAASQIAKMLRPDNRTSTGISLRRSTRKRKIPVNFECYEASSGTDDDIIGSAYRRSHRMENSGSQDDISHHNCRKIHTTRLLPRREGLRPRSGKDTAIQAVHIESEREDASSEMKGSESEEKNGNQTVDNDAKNDGTEGEDEEDEDPEDDDEDDDGGEEEGHEGRRRYDLRNRADVQRFSMDERKKRVRSSRRAVQHGLGSKVRDVRKSGSRVHKHHRLERADDTDDSLLVDELDQGPTIPWGRGGSKSGAPWLFGGLDVPGASPWGLNVAASGWGHHGDTFTTLSSGIPTTGPSSKGGADIQPLQVDESLSFEDIGGLSDHINALKEMVFFPLLYPDFFASYHITPPRGVLLCGPPGTGKTMIARALACAASKAGEKVSFYMRKGADVLSKWVGEAERQLKLLFEEAQKNQPSIIFFDEIDGLAPVRSSKQEQIHNSIVSTLLALMDGLDSRGQVILIGATNRVDAIDGALRRPGRFDREFNFPLPGYGARADILDIHTRKWKLPPSEELRSELAARCVGYCGADLKSLCTEAAIYAFREKYPQVYTSDDKFLVDVDSVKVRRYHFLEAMSKITAAAHRGAIVNSRPLSPIITPCLKQHLQKAMDYVRDILPTTGTSTRMNKISMLSNDSAVSLVYRPRLCLCGGEGVGLDHLAPAILHELEKFPVHSLGLPCLLSDPGAKTAEEALVHAFGEARRTMPSILYVPQFHLWWEAAHEQLRGVLLTLLEELPSSLPILLIGTYFGSPYSMDPAVNGIFPQHTIYTVTGPSYEDRLLFFDNLIADALSVSLEKSGENLKCSDCLPELQKAPKIVTGPKASEIKAKVEAEQHVLRRMRMCLRDVCNRILYDRRFSMFHYPVLDEDAPNYRTVVQTPMDVATLLHQVDRGEYITCTNFLRDVDLIVNNAKAYNGDDYNGARIVSRAFELRDAVHGMLSQMDPVLLASCEKIAAQGGPSQHPENSGDVSAATSVPVVQLAAITRASSRLRNVNVEVNLEHTHEAVKRAKKNSDSFAHNNTAGEEKGGNEWKEESKIEKKGGEDGMGEEEENCEKMKSSIKSSFVDKSEGYGIPELERLYSKVMKGVLQNNGPFTTSSLLHFLSHFANDTAHFSP